MIEKVRAIWITGFLQQSLPKEIRILLGLSERPDAVARPFDLLVKRPDQGERPLPSGVQVVEVFDTNDRALLILGGPGSGKTTLLLELARDLLDRADHDPTHAIPVVFPLSTWAENCKPVVRWLEDELNLRYDVPRKIAKQWIESDQVLPLLDGLDEVKAEHRAACAEAINVFRQSHGFLPLAITSRTSDYEAFAQPLRLHGAILVRPLTREQVNTYLADLGSAGEPVCAAIREDSSLWALVDSPLMLNMVMVAYSGQADSRLPLGGTVTEMRLPLFRSYVNEMLRRRAAERRYTPAQIVHWLSWLAFHMAEHGQTVFGLERLQRDWLPESQQLAIRASNALIFGLVSGLVGGLVLGPFCGLVGGLGASGLVRGLLGGLIVGLGSGLLVGSIIGIASSLRDITCVDVVEWSLSRTTDHMLDCLVAGIGLGLVSFAFAIRLEQGLVRLVVELVVALIFGLIIGLVFGLVTGPIFGLVGGSIEIRSHPNEGIHRSARNALARGLVLGLAGGLAGGLVSGLIGGLGGLRLGLIVGLGSGLLLGLFATLVGVLHAGGEACLKHLVLRLWLIRNDSTPRNYVRFLDFAADRILLRKVGGGYMFIHRMLLDYFAARYVESSFKRADSPKPSGIKLKL